jgi:hypothetical protein
MRNKWIIILIVIAVIITIQIIHNSVSAKTAKDIGQINFLIGRPNDIQLQHRGDDSWHDARLRASVKEGDMVKTEKESRCEIKLHDGSMLRVGEESLYDLGEAEISNSRKKIHSKLHRGSVWANLASFFRKDDSFQILSPTAVCAVRGTIYRVSADSSTNIVVYDGEVDVGPTSFWNQQQLQPTQGLAPQEIPGPHEVPGPYEVSLDEWIRIVKGFQINIRKDGKYQKSKIDLEKDAQSDWVQWNLERDKSIERE